jgi:hypothetical protein
MTLSADEQIEQLRRTANERAMLRLAAERGCGQPAGPSPDTRPA